MNTWDAWMIFAIAEAFAAIAGNHNDPEDEWCQKHN